jgi:ribosomal protein L11 methyltransferase
VTPLWRVSARARGDDAEPLRARLLALAPEGFEELDVASGVELAAYVASDRVEELRAALPDAAVSPVEDGWEETWRAFHRPVVIDGLWIGPSWERPPDPGCAIVIDPGRAFGTGSHPTTRVCVELLARTTVRGSLLDVGCGSGVLAIAAARLGFAPVLAIDVDPVAVETTLANATANGVELDARVLDALTMPLSATDVAVANVLLDPVEAILFRLRSDEAITSGYLAGERPAHAGWVHVEALEHDGWGADRFRRP